MTELERVWKKAGWHLVTRSGDPDHIKRRAAEMEQQEWQVAAIPHGRRSWALWTAPKGVAAP